MTTRDANRAKWVEIVNRFRGSGLTKPEFARREKLRLTDLRNWDYRLPGKGRKSGRSGKKALRLVPVAIRPSELGSARPQGTIVIDVRTLQVAAGAGVDSRMVIDLVAGLRELAC